MKYTVTYDDGHTKGFIEVDAPDRLPQPGDVYRWTRPGATLGGNKYQPGQTMTVIERTDLVPHHRTSSLGNLLIEGPYGTSVWTCFEMVIAEGSLELVSSSPVPDVWDRLLLAESEA